MSVIQKFRHAEEEKLRQEAEAKKNEAARKEAARKLDEERKLKAAEDAAKMEEEMLQVRDFK